jgi:DNA-binding GntR family transcriptional regulator
VSTTPVREAFAALAREGLARQNSHRGLVVLSTSADDARENVEMRAVLEAFAAEQAARTITEEELASLDALLVEMRAALRSDSAYDNQVLNPRFHAIINGARVDHA